MSKNNERIEMPDEVHEWLMQYLKPYGLSLLKYHDNSDEMWKGLVYHGLVRNLYRQDPETRKLHYYEALRIALSEEINFSG